MAEIFREKSEFFLILHWLKHQFFINYIFRNFFAGFCIIKDICRSYNVVNSLGYDHSVVNNSEHFVNPADNLLHTNTIKGFGGV